MAIEPNRWGVVYNPKAGSRKTQKRWNEIREYMESKGVLFDYVQSEGYGSVERLTRILANNGYQTIVVVGGDGAINDAVNGIMGSSAENKEKIALGIIPNGIGNDFAQVVVIGVFKLVLDYNLTVSTLFNGEKVNIEVANRRFKFF